MVHKRCALCSVYFVGELDGSYVCPNCQAQSAKRDVEAARQPAQASPSPTARSIN